MVIFTDRELEFLVTLRDNWSGFIATNSPAS